MSKPWSSLRPSFERVAVAHLATILPDGSPHSVPVWVEAVDDEHLAFFMLAGSRKDRNLQRDPRFALSITNPAEPLDMAAARGAVVERLDGEEAQAMVDRIARKYTGESYQRGDWAAFVVRPEVWWGTDYSGSSA